MELVKRSGIRLGRIAIPELPVAPGNHKSNGKHSGTTVESSNKGLFEMRVPYIYTTNSLVQLTMGKNPSESHAWTSWVFYRPSAMIGSLIAVDSCE